MSDHQIILDYLINELKHRIYHNLSGPRDGSSVYEKGQEKRISELTFDTNVIEDGVIDSFGLVNVRHFLEVNFKIVIPDEMATVKTMSTVNDMVELIKKCKK